MEGAQTFNITKTITKVMENKIIQSRKHNPYFLWVSFFPNRHIWNHKSKFKEDFAHRNTMQEHFYPFRNDWNELHNLSTAYSDAYN